MESEPLNRQQSLNSRSHGEWLQIQKTTFTNWVNEGLRPRGITVEDVRTDFADGVKLVALVESLTRHRVPGHVSVPSNGIQKLQNITIALDALTKDGVKLVNIDSSDIHECNMKLVLALIWQLILKYQVGLSGPQNKSWILKWLNAVIPECNIKNFTTDWNSGLALHALLDFCKPGLSPQWRNLDKENKVDNCRSALKMALQNFNIPMILRPEDLASPDLDEKSAITYLSYFIKVGGPGYDATLQRVSARTQPKSVTNFTSDWQDGEALANLVRSAGGQVNVQSDEQGKPLAVIKKAVEAGKELGVDPLLSAEDIASDSPEHLGMMAYGAQYLRQPNVVTYSNHANETVVIVNRKQDTAVDHNGHLNDHNEIISRLHTHNKDHSGYNNNNDSFKDKNHAPEMKPLKITTFREDDEFISSHVAKLASPAAPPQTKTFHLVRKSSFHAPRVEMPSSEQLKVDIYSVGVIMESRMSGLFDPERFRVEAEAPSGRVIRISGDGNYAAQFNADEIGRWKVAMYYDNKFMDGCPIDVCDPSQVRVHDLHGGLVGKSNSFQVDCSRAGHGDLGVDITHQGKKILSHISPTQTPGYYKVTFTPYSPGAYAINVHFNRAEVREGYHEFLDPSERQRKAVFYTRVEPELGYVNVKASCDWEIEYITGHPFICHVTDSSDIAVYGMQDGTVCAHPEMIADCTRVGDGRIDAEVTYQGTRFPCEVKKDKPCIYKVSFRPRGPGTYKVWINYDGQPIKGSPFIQEIAELEKPSARGDGLYRGVPNKPATFIVDPRGFPGEVSVSVEGPSKPVQSTLERLPDDTIKATYYPIERGPHTVRVKMDDKHIDGSPFKPLIVDPVNVRVSGGWRPYLDDTGVIPLKVNKEKHLPFDVSEAGPGELTAEVEGPNGKIPVAIDARKDGKHSVVFTPREEGKHNIHVKWGGYPLSNSPYLGIATHEPELDETDFARVLHIPFDKFSSPDGSVVGSDLPPATIHYHEPEVHKPVEYRAIPPKEKHKPTTVIYTPSNAVVNGPPKETYQPPLVYYSPSDDDLTKPKVIEYNPDHKQTRVKVLPVQNAAPPKAKEVDSLPLLELTETISRNRPTSSRSSTASQTNSPRESQKVILSGKGLKEAEVGKPAKFKVDGTAANPGRPKAHLQGVRENIPVTSEPVIPQIYDCTYVPQKPGAYLLYIDWNDKPLKGSPFKVNVREPAQPQKVTTVKPNQNVYMGKDLEMKIDPREAGPGKLTVTCLDPLKRSVPVQLNDNFDGTKSLKVTPQMAGRHIVDIRYDGKHIMGSPYAIDIKESQVKGQVKVWGPGIQSGILPEFRGTFWVETTGAGAGELTVRINGPKGAFKVMINNIFGNLCLCRSI
ncbi:filamin-A-like isoform X2 [Biomphalaria glabrata]|uniref:Filamin-A-like isoform X2 n=1 Tax=Biomphalaria glabrata TaxID=6526 RepID=A0A9W2Z009_BIOGL|nr:filamin-A-like isoform X2 [Biomphalaria glabrata]